MSSPLKLNLYKPIKHTIPSSRAILLLLCKTDIRNFSAASQQLLSAATTNNSAQLLFLTTSSILLILSFLIILSFSCIRIIESISKHHR
ncbi:unnamed protein product [Prunus brigantina]